MSQTVERLSTNKWIRWGGHVLLPPSGHDGMARPVIISSIPIPPRGHLGATALLISRLDCKLVHLEAMASVAPQENYMVAAQDLCGTSGWGKTDLEVWRTVN